MYSREINGKTLTFEPSGALLNASLVMRDRETDSWWSIITDRAIHGAVEGERLRQLQGAEKTTFGAWRARHPDTLVLSVDGVEHVADAHYDSYFASAEGFRGLSAVDDRLADKASIFAFHWRGRPHAVPHPRFVGGGVIELDDGQRLFLYRQADDSHYRSTLALRLPAGARLERTGSDDGWRLRTDDGRPLRFDPEARRFAAPEASLEPVAGFDTYWYIWSLTHPETELLDEPPG